MAKAIQSNFNRATKHLLNKQMSGNTIGAGKERMGMQMWVGIPPVLQRLKN